jgi:SAM-dependent methyltransferase
LDFEIEKSNKLFKRMLDIYGPYSAEALHWKNETSQFLRYDIFSQIGELEGASLLDMGAGLGDLYGYLKKKGYRKINYLGVEVLPDFVKSAKEKYPDARFLVGDLLSFKPDKKYDYVISCGALNVKIGDMERLVKKAIKRLFDMCNTGCAFNLLSENARFKDSSLYNYNPLKIIKYCMQLTPYITYRHDYLDNDFTIFMYKRQRFTV